MNKAVQIIGVPIDLGQSHRGVDLGPGALRYAGLEARLEQLGYEVNDYGNLYVPVRESLSRERAQRYLPSIQKVCEAACLAGSKAVEEGYIPVFLGGDHSISIGSIAGVAQREPAGVLWIDAHGDFNTGDSSSSGNIHGMALALLLGLGYPELVAVGGPQATLQAKDVVMIGVRELDPQERHSLRESGVTVYTMRDIDERGIGAVTAEALVKLGHRQRLHVSLDIDALDPQAAPGAGTLVDGGLSYREAQLLMEIVADSERLCSLDIVEINPILDNRNKTAQTAVELTASLFGKSIL
ncbi:MAG: arginase [Gammaproteobacteria bacterium]|nr:arginase [Gammaproteobacteria bacterium]